MKAFVAIVISTLLSVFSLSGQFDEFAIDLEPVEVEGLGGLQSYAFGQYDGKWLIVGGRLDGLHRRQPFAAFDLAGNNTTIWVIDPVSRKKWSAPLSLLPADIREPLSSTNMEFTQSEDILYCIGGYGYSATIGDHLTYDKLTAIDLAGVIPAIIDGRDISKYFSQTAHEVFRVTGGQLEKIDDVYYLLGGQKFMGRYNPMGPDHGPGFIQEYTNAVHRFTITNDGENLSVSFLDAFVDEENLHRRDYNAIPQIYPDGSHGITMFSGVFQHNIDLPFLNVVDVNDQNIEVADEFIQQFNHYHCPTVGLFSATEKKMYNLFFGGIAQFYMDGDVLVQDDNVPFVSSITAVTRDGSGKLTETLLPIEMPALLGAGAEFIPADLETYENAVINYDDLTGKTLLGYIYGGIESDDRNIFWTTEGEASIASPTIYKVWLTKTSTSVADGTSTDEHILVYPNPNNGIFNIDITLDQKPKQVSLSLFDVQGQTYISNTYQNLNAGKNKLTLYYNELDFGNTYILKLVIDGEEIIRKVVVAL